MKVDYIDFSSSPEFKREDFSDIAHLNCISVDRFTTLVDSKFKTLTQTK